MKKIRKGSIVWDLQHHDKLKVLTTPGSGELPDALCFNTGRKYDPKIFGNFVLVKTEENLGIGPTCNNVRCRIRRIKNLIPYDEHLKHLEDIQSLMPPLK
jgi:hypothetical protein